MIPTSSLSPNEANPRSIADDALRRLKESIERDPAFMKLRPIVVDESTRKILGGNQRFRACLELGMTELPDEWVMFTDLSPEQQKRFVLVDNTPEGMSGEWDYDILQMDYAIEDLLDAGFPDWVGNFFEAAELQPAEQGYGVNSQPQQSTPAAIEVTSRTQEEVYTGMPTHGVEEEEGVTIQGSIYRTLKVHFRNEENLQQFLDLVGHHEITEDTKYIWFPPERRIRRLPVEFGEGDDEVSA